MRRNRLWIALCLAASATLGACRTIPPAPPAGACTDWRWIGITRPGAGCPQAPPGWTSRSLFANLGEPDDGRKHFPDSKVFQELRRFCSYEIADSDRSASDVPALDLGGDLERLDRDCAALSVGADSARPSDLVRLREEVFPAQAGLGGSLAIANERGVRLAFLDTQPTADDLPETRGSAPLHGFTLAQLARRMVCQDSACAARITTRLALPIRDFDPARRGDQIDTLRGGYIGLQGDLAQAILSEVDAWRVGDRSQKHLVLNLSLAWDGRFFGGLTKEQIDEMQAGTQAVYRALQYAAGYDVLVLAAAGNQKRPPCQNSGPLLPAAWESAGRRGEERLLYAVGGVRSDGKRLVNTRRKGMPRRAAFGVIPAWNDTGGEPEAILVGSSVATAVVSSIAAVVWDSFPELDSRKVMDILDKSGEELSYQADFWSGTGAAPAVHWLSLCRTVKTACEETGGRCPLQSSCPALISIEDTTSSLLAHPQARGSCRPWVMPQPEDDPCPVCKPPAR